MTSNLSTWQNFSDEELCQSTDLGESLKQKKMSAGGCSLEDDSAAHRHSHWRHNRLFDNAATEGPQSGVCSACFSLFMHFFDSPGVALGLPLHRVPHPCHYDKPDYLPVCAVLHVSLSIMPPATFCTFDHNRPSLGFWTALLLSSVDLLDTKGIAIPTNYIGLQEWLRTRAGCLG